MKVLFIYPNVSRDRSAIVGLSSLAGTLKAEGHDCSVFDITFLDDSEIQPAFRHTVESYQPDLIGISSRSTEWETSKSILTMIDADVPVVVGGPHATIAPGEVIAEERVDMLVRGEGEKAIIDLLTRLQSGSSLKDMPNLWVKEDGQVFKNDVGDLVEDLDELALPDWSIWDERHFSEHYHRGIYPEARAFGDLETSRGCPYACPYCLTPVMQELYKGKGRYHREKSAGRIIEEIEKIQAERNIDYVRFVDETFILNRKRLKEFCGLYEHIGLPFSFCTRPETVNDEIMSLLSDAGANWVSLGLESGNENYRREMLNRKMTQEDIINAVAIARRNNIKTFGCIMIGLPEEDRGMIQDTMELINTVKPDVFQITIFYPFKGTPLYDYCIEKGFIEEDHERLTQIWQGSVLKQTDLPNDYLIRLRELMFDFSTRNRKWWPLMYYLEKSPRAFRAWQSFRSPLKAGKRVSKKLAGAGE